jgi:hypothetical protein
MNISGFAVIRGSNIRRIILRSSPEAVCISLKDGMRYAVT